jgi:hypothetical protein
MDLAAGMKTAAARTRGRWHQTSGPGGRVRDGEACGIIGSTRELQRLAGGDELLVVEEAAGWCSGVGGHALELGSVATPQGNDGGAIHCVSLATGSMDVAGDGERTTVKAVEQSAGKRAESNMSKEAKVMWGSPSCHAQVSKAAVHVGLRWKPLAARQTGGKRRGRSL